MTSHRERLEACLRGQKPDRPPVALWRHFPVDDQKAETLAEAHLAFQEQYDFDLVKVTPASSFSVRDWGVEDDWQENTEGTRTYTRRAIADPADWEALSVLDPDAPYLSQQLECLLRIRTRLSATTPVLQTVFNPLAQAKHLAGEEILLQHLRHFPDQLRRGLATIAESTRLFVRAARDLGIDGIFYAVQHAQSELLSQEEFQRFSSQDDLAILDSASGLWCNMLHLHGRNVHIQAVNDYPAQILNWHDRESSPSLADARRLWPGILCGGISRNSLVRGTDADVLAEANEALSSLELGDLILSTGCVVPIIAPHGNIRAARQSVESWAPAKSR